MNCRSKLNLFFFLQSGKFNELRKKNLKTSFFITNFHLFRSIERLAPLIPSNLIISKLIFIFIVILDTQFEYFLESLQFLYFLEDVGNTVLFILDLEAIASCDRPRNVFLTFTSKNESVLDNS